MIEGLSKELLTGEHVLWEGRPGTGIILRPIEWVLIPFSLLWGGFALFWNVSVWTIDAGADLPFKLFGLPFIVAGLYITFGRFWADAWIRRRLVYLVTDQRILILKRTAGSTTKSLDIRRLPALEFDERPDGAGTIRFGAASSWFAGGNFGIWQPTFDQTPQFIRIDRVRSVYELIQKQAA